MSLVIKNKTNAKLYIKKKIIHSDNVVAIKEIKEIRPEVEKKEYKPLFSF